MIEVSCDDEHEIKATRQAYYDYVTQSSRNRPKIQIDSSFHISLLILHLNSYCLYSVFDMADKPAPKLSLYANLLNPGAATALSSEPVLYKKEEQDAKAAQVEAARQKLSAGTYD